MNPTTDAMRNFLKSITPTLSEEQNLNDREKIVKNNLSMAVKLDRDINYISAERMGSAAKGTLIRPIDDMDFLAIFSANSLNQGKYNRNSRDFLYKIRELYNRTTIADVGSRQQSVRVLLKNYGHVDIAPVFSDPWTPGVYSLPKGDGTWIKTSPLKARDWFLAKDRSFNGNLAPLVRLTKAWNRNNGSHISSYLLETMVAETFAAFGDDWQNNLYLFFKNAVNRFSTVQDPGGQSGYLSSGYSSQQIAEIKFLIIVTENQCREAIEAEKRGSYDKANGIWRSILGSSF